MQPGKSGSGEEDRDGASAYVFGQFRLDLKKHTLFTDAEPHILRPKSYEVLKYLLENAGRVVGRDELFDAVWPDLVVTEDSQTQCLIEIRRALGDENRTLIQTFPRRGYLLDAQVTVERKKWAQLTSPSLAVTNWRRPPSWWSMAALLLLALAVAAIWWRTSSLELEDGKEAVTEWQPPPASVAVLPFADMSKEGDQQYLAEGIAEEILNLLAQSPDLTVIARTSSFSFRDSNADIGTIARQLGVAYVLEGSVRKSGEQVRVTTQLVESSNSAHIWSQTFDDSLVDVFALQDRVAQAVAAVLEVELTQASSTSDENSVYTPDPQAWETYLRGRLFYSRRGEGDFIRAQRSFEEALAIDPQFADAWVALSATIWQRLRNEQASEAERLLSAEAVPMIREYLEKALSIDPNHPEALWRFGGRIWSSNPERAFELIVRAAELGHNNAMVQAMMGGFLLERGHPQTAIPFLQRAATLDPLSASHLSPLGAALYRTDRFPESERVFLHAAELRRHPPEQEQVQLSWVKIFQNDLVTAESIAESLPAGPDRVMTLAIVNHLQGRPEKAQQALTHLLTYPETEVAGHIARVESMRGDTDEAFQWLESAIDANINLPIRFRARQEITSLQFSPFLKPLHNDERWHKLWRATKQELLDETDFRVIAFLEAYLERNARLYVPTATVASVK